MEGFPLARHATVGVGIGSMIMAQLEIQDLRQAFGDNAEQGMSATVPEGGNQGNSYLHER
jgi:hypothetical protein